MLHRVRIEVREDTADEAVEALTKYFHALHVIEAERYKARIEEVTGRTPAEHQPWEVDVEHRDFFNSELGAELTEQVIEYVADWPGFQGRAVVKFSRVDTRMAWSEQELEPHGSRINPRAS